MSDDLSLDARLLRFRSDPGAEACHDLSAALLDAQRAREALEVLSRGLSLKEDDSRLLRLASRAFLAEGDVLRAQQTLTRVIRMHPDDVDAYRLLAETLAQRGDVGRAAAAVAKAISLAPGDAGLLALRRRLAGGGDPSPSVLETPASVPAETPAQAVSAPEVTVSPEPAALPEPHAGLETEQEALVRDVQVMLGQAMKAISPPPPAMEVPDPATRPSRRPLPSPGLLAAKLPPRSVPPAAAGPSPSALSEAVAPAPAGPAPVAPALEVSAPTPDVSPASAVVPPGPMVPAPAGPGARPGPRRSPTLMGFAPPRPPARPASVPPPARSAPLPAIRPPSVRPPSMTGPVVAPPNFGPPVVAAPLPAPASLPAPAPLAPPPVRQEAVEQDEDEPTSFMDRESLAGALGASQPPPPRESKRPLEAAEPVNFTVSRSPARPGVASPLPDTLPEFVVPELSDLPVVEGSKRSAARMAQRLDAEPSARTSLAPQDTDEVAAAPARRSGSRLGVVLLVAVLLVIGGGFVAHRAGLLPQLGAPTGEASEAQPAVPTTPEPTPPVVQDEPAPAPVLDEAATRLGDLEGALAAGRVPADLPEDDAPQSLRLRAEAALLYETPWWSATPVEVDHDAMDTLVTSLTGATDGATPEDAAMLRATVVRLKSTTEAATALSDARALASEHPDDPLVRWALAEALLASGELAEADTLLRSIVESGPERMRARAAMQRLWVALRRDDHATASAALDVARGLAPEWTLVRLRALDLRLAAGEYRPVLAELAPADGEAPAADDDPELLLRQLRAQLGLEQLDASEALWERLPEAMQQRADVQPIAAEYFVARGEPAEAVRALASLAQAEPGDPTLIAQYANALYESGQTLVASAQFERAIALDQGHPEALIGFAQVLLRARKYREARINLDRAEAGLRGRVRPPATLAHLRVMRARIMVEERELAQAATLLRRTLEIEGAPSEGWFYLGEALSRSHSTESRAAYERYLSLHPAGPLATRARRAIQ